MKYNKLGSTDMEVSCIALGCWAFAGDSIWGAQDEKDSIATVSAALDCGINFFDTAEVYGKGRSEKVLGKALVGRRHRALIATKVGSSHLSYEDVIKSCEGSLKRLRTEYIDLYQIHWPNRNVRFEETMEALLKLKEQGKIRAIGVSNFGVNDMEQILSLGPIETNQLAYNLLWRAIEFNIIPKCISKGIGILCYSPLAQGLLTGKYESIDKYVQERTNTRFFSSERSGTRHNEKGFEKELFEILAKIRMACKGIGEPMAKVSLSWLLQREGVTSVLAGARNPEQVVQNAKAVELDIPHNILNKLNEETMKLKHDIGANPDMWSSRIR